MGLLVELPAVGCSEGHVPAGSMVGGVAMHLSPSGIRIQKCPKCYQHAETHFAGSGRTPTSHALLTPPLRSQTLMGNRMFEVWDPRKGRRAESFASNQHDEKKFPLLRIPFFFFLRVVFETPGFPLEIPPSYPWKAGSWWASGSRDRLDASGLYGSETLCPTDQTEQTERQAQQAPQIPQKPT